MIYFIILIFIIFIAIFMWMRKDYRKQRKDHKAGEEKPAFRTDKDLQEYGKKMKDGEEDIMDLHDSE